MRKILLFSLSLFLFFCKKDTEEDINLYHTLDHEIVATAQKSIGGKDVANWKALGRALISSKVAKPEDIILLVGTVSEEGFTREDIGITLPIKTGLFKFNRTLNSPSPYAGYGIWASDGHVLDASYDCDTTLSFIKVIQLDTVKKVMSGEFELHFNSFNPGNGYPKTTIFKNGKFDVKIEKY